MKDKGKKKERELVKELTEKTFILTDGCMWEMNKQMGTSAPHAVEVVDLETGQVRYIKSGSKIRFVEGDITSERIQEVYNKLKTPKL